MKTDYQAEKNRAYKYLDGIAERLYGYADTVRGTPELGFREEKTSAFVEERMRALGLYNVRRVALTGVAAELSPPRRGEERVCVIGELDAVLTPDCPYADRVTGAAHTCGHHIQIAELLGVAEALKNSGVSDVLGGNVTFLAVPAEEFVDLEYREGLRREGKLRELSGKLELLQEGFFDGISCAMMVHAQPNCPEPACFVACNSLGFVAKTVHFRGRAAHAGGAPWDGINALNAAMAAMVCINAMRETFRDSDRIRVHPIITKGGDLVNIVPADVTMETYVRGATPKRLRMPPERLTAPFAELPMRSVPRWRSGMSEATLRWRKTESSAHCLPTMRVPSCRRTGSFRARIWSAPPIWGMSARQFPPFSQPAAATAAGARRGFPGDRCARGNSASDQADDRNGDRPARQRS